MCSIATISHKARGCIMCAEAIGKEHPDKKDYWHNELKSLGIEPKRDNELNNEKELSELADNLKQTLYQDYKTAYSDDKIEESDFDYII